MNPEIIQEIRNYLDRPGMNRRKLAKAADVWPSVITRIMNGDQKTINSENYLKIMAVVRKV